MAGVDGSHYAVK